MLQLGWARFAPLCINDATRGCLFPSKKRPKAAFFLCSFHLLAPVIASMIQGHVIDLAAGITPVLFHGAQEGVAVLHLHPMHRALGPGGGHGHARGSQASHRVADCPFGGERHFGRFRPTHRVGSLASRGSGGGWHDQPVRPDRSQVCSARLRQSRGPGKARQYALPQCFAGERTRCAVVYFF